MQLVVGYLGLYFFNSYNRVGSFILCDTLQVIAESLSEDEIAGLKEMFKMIDTDNSGQITYEELKAGLQRAGANLKESEISALMDAVCANFASHLQCYI